MGFRQEKVDDANSRISAWQWQGEVEIFRGEGSGVQVGQVVRVWI